ncbi:MAG TPA: hypothetical protein VFB62_07005 [Polyangiaceae bacterium]|jgi:hypothetical protein|nr:hypothetical protein [Polyangiaceae bacterium]
MKSALSLAACSALLLVSAAVAGPPPVDVNPPHVNFGSNPYESNTKRSFTVTNRGSESVMVSIEQVSVGDDFSPGQIESTCPLTDSSMLEPGQSCTHVVGFRPSPFFGGHESALMRVVVRDMASNVIYTRDIKLTGRGY